MNKELLRDIVCQSSSDYDVLNDVYAYIELLEKTIDTTIKYVEKLSSKGKGCEIYSDIKREILCRLKIKEKTHE